MLFILIEYQRRGAYKAVFDRRSVDRDGLDGRAGRARGSRCSVQAVVYGLVARAAAQSLDLAGGLIDDDDGALKLRFCAAVGLGQLLGIGVYRVDLGLNVLIYAGIDLVAGVMHELACSVAADALCLGKVADDVGQNDFFVI